MAQSGNRKVLVVEDDRKTAAILCDYLETGGFDAVHVGGGPGAIETAKATQLAAILLDISLPGIDGIEVCRAVRAFSAVPIIMITARVDDSSLLHSLEIGADDYICKPFSPKEVMARLAALIRRAEGLFAAATWQIDDEGMRIAYRGDWLTLTPIEFRLLRCLVQQPGRVFSREQMLHQAYDDFRDVSDRAIDSHIKNIRKKVRAVANESGAIESVYGFGYRYTPDE